MEICVATRMSDSGKDPVPFEPLVCSRMDAGGTLGSLRGCAFHSLSNIANVCRGHSAQMPWTGHLKDLYLNEDIKPQRRIVALWSTSEEWEVDMNFPPESGLQQSLDNLAVPHLEATQSIPPVGRAREAREVPRSES